MSLRSVAFLAATLTVAPLGLLAAQQAAAPTGTPTTAEVPATTTTATALGAVTPGPSVPQPQYSPVFQTRDSAPVFAPDKNAMASAGSNHTIVVSTLVLVLAVVILVLLVF